MITSGFYVMDWPNTEHRNVMFTGSTAQSYALPNAHETPGLRFTFKLQGTGTVTISAPSPQTIDGAATYALTGLNAHVTLLSDGTNWNIISV